MKAKAIARWIFPALTAAALACSAGPAPREIGEARLALQDAKNAGAAERSPREYDAATAHFNVAQKAWTETKDPRMAAHWARLAEGEARHAQGLAEFQAASEALRQETQRKQRGELAVRDAEIAMLQSRARTDAEKRAAEAEARAAQDRQRNQEELARREAAARETERVRADAEARLAAERGKAERETAQRTQAEKDRIAAELEKTRVEMEAARKAADEARAAAEAERKKLEDQRKADEARQAEFQKAREAQMKTEEELKKTLSQLAQVREDARGLILTLPGSIYFDVNKSEVKPAMRARLTEIAQALATVPDRKVLIEGHTDSDGGSEYNLKLSGLRADSVRSILIAGGVSTDRLESQGYGETKSVAPNTTASGKAQNRRVEIVLQGSAR